MADWKNLQEAYCPRCKAAVQYPASLTAEEKAAIAGENRADRLEALRRWRAAYDLDLATAKGLGFHITREPGVCHRCKHPTSGSESVCTNCKSFNLDW